MAFQEVDCRQRQFALFLAIDGFGRVAMLPRLNFDEDDDLPVATDQVDFPLSRSISLNQHFEPTSAEEAGGRPFASVAQPTVPEGSHDR